MIGVLLTIALQAGASAAPPPEGESAMRGRNGAVEVISAGSEPLLRAAGRTIGRPFGAELVDRLSITGRQRVGADDVFIVRGSRGSECPARYVAVTLRQSGMPAVSRPFGNCQPIVASSNRGGRLSVTLDGPAAETFVYASGEMQPLEPSPARFAQAPVAQCEPYRAGLAGDATRQERLLAFERDYPRELRRGKVEKAALSPGELSALLGEMACLAAWPESGARIPRLAAPLFRSRRHGREAFATVESLSRSPAISESTRAALRSFAASMYFEASFERWL